MSSLSVGELRGLAANNTVIVPSNQTLQINGGFRVPTWTTASRPANLTGSFGYNTENEVLEFYNGTEWVEAGGSSVPDGSSADKAAPSANDIKLANPAAPDGVYWIDLPSSGPTQLYCIMNSAYDQGGWQMAMKATRGGTFEYDSGYWTNGNTLNTSATNQNDGDAKFASFNNFQAKDIFARWPDIGSGGSIGGLGNWTWLENNFYGGNRITLRSLFSSVDRYFIRDALNFSGWGGPWSTQNDVRFYGFNYRSNGTDTRTRWGFGWNENGGGLYPNGNMGSDDVGGGIGMKYRGGSRWSAGDVVGCCQNRTGMRRNERVEIYVR